MGGRYYAIFLMFAVLAFFLAPDAHSATHSRKHAKNHARKHAKKHAGAHPSALRHRVKGGETLYGIARAYGLGVDELRRANRIKGNVIAAGRVLRIPRGHAVAAVNAVQPDTSSTQVGGEAGTGAAAVHVVVGGETLYSIGRTYKVELAALRDLNHIKGNRIKAGQEILIPGAKTSEAASAEPEDAHAEAEKPSSEDAYLVARLAPFNDDGVLSIERRFNGVPYRFGGSGMDGIDCSGFTKSVFDSFGLTLPRSAREQFLVGMPVDKSELRRGDLVFFSTYAKYPSHVGIYVGDGRFMHMSTRKSTVEITDLNDGYYVSNYLGARRVLPAQ